MKLTRSGIILTVAVGVFVLAAAIEVMLEPSSLPHLIDKAVAVYLIGWSLYRIISPLPRTEVAKRFILVSLTLACCWLVAESAALIGVLDYRTVFRSFDPKDPLSDPGKRYDPDLMWQHEPYYGYVAAYEGNLGHALCRPPDPSRLVAVRYDRNGFRNSQDMTAAEIAIIGDSYVESPMTPEPLLTATLLSQLQGRTVANLGHSGYGPQQELIVLQRFALPLQPKAVIWAFFEGNDFSNADDFATRMAKRPSASPFWQNVWSRSLTRSLLALYFHRPQACRPNQSIARYRADFSDSRQGTQPVYFAPTEVTAPSAETLRRAAEPLAEAAALCRKRGIRFIVAFVPEKYRVYHDLANVSLGTEEIRAWTVDDIPRRLERFLAEQAPDAEFVDLTPALKKASRAGIATYLPDDTHWTAAGHRVAAQALDETLKSRAITTPTQTARRE